MTVFFPTRGYLASNYRKVPMGEPVHARPCRCDRPWLFDPDECTRCGRLTGAAIGVTWAEQAKRLRGGTWAGTTPRVAAQRTPRGAERVLQAV